MLLSELLCGHASKFEGPGGGVGSQVDSFEEATSTTVDKPAPGLSRHAAQFANVKWPRERVSRMRCCLQLSGSWLPAERVRYA